MQGNQKGSDTSDNNQTSQKYGKNMMFIFWGISLILLTTIFGQWEESQINPNSTPESRYSGQTTEVFLERNRYGHYVTSGEINHNRVTFLVDTGATNVAIPGELESLLGVQRGREHYVNTANGTAIAYSTILDSLKIGDIELYNVRASISPSMQGHEILLGMSVLNQLEFVQKDNRLTLRQHH